MELNYDVIIVGAGLVGLTAALTCAHKGLRAALLDAREIDGHSDKRASALTVGSYNLLGHLGLTVALNDSLQPMHKMHIADAHIGKISPLALEFSDAKTDGPTGYMIENEILRSALLAGTEDSDLIDIFAPTQITGTTRGSRHVTVSLPDQDLTAALLIAADGRRSSLRKAAKITSLTKNYNQMALVASFAHSQPHNGTAYQYFYSGGPLALLPLTDNRMSIVWSDRPDAIKAAMALPEPDFMCELERRIDQPLGQMILSAPRQSFPLSLQIAQQYTDHRLALIGDAAHAIHPLAGQGLNLGFRDVAALIELLHDAKGRGLDLGTATLEGYENWRPKDAQLLGATTDMLNKLFSNNIAPLRHARRIALFATNRLSGSKELLMKQAEGSSGNAPVLLKG